MSTTTLPRLTPKGTPLCGSPKAKRSSSHGSKPRTAAISLPRAYELYPPSIPTADIQHRVNPLRPPPPKKFNHMLETEDLTFHNYMRSVRMRQREHFRYHTSWGKYYYGSVAEQEQHRAHTRSVLKQQMADKEERYRQSQISKVDESINATARDERDKLEDTMNYLKKYEQFKRFRDDNKTMMEDVWSKSKQQKRAVDQFDREQLKYNPINWSCTLK